MDCGGDKEGYVVEDCEVAKGTVVVEDEEGSSSVSPRMLEAL